MPPRPIEILLVEDSPADVWLIRETLRQGPVLKHIRVVTNGEQALEYLRGKGRFTDSVRPDLVLLDLNLPRRDGFEVLRAIKGDPDLRAITVIVLTTSDAPIDVNTAYDLNANCYVVKPVSLEDFTIAIRAIEDFWMLFASLPTLGPILRANEELANSATGDAETNGGGPSIRSNRKTPVRRRQIQTGHRRTSWSGLSRLPCIGKRMTALKGAFSCGLVTLCLALSLNAATPVFLDTDIGDDIDDALALSLALQSPELNILGITTVLQDGARRADLVWKILDLFGRTDIPIGRGAEQPLMARPRTGTVRQTEALSEQDHMPSDRRRNGLELLIDTCLHAQDKVTIIAYGPLTNIALALRAEPGLREKVDRIVLMNGVFFRPGLEYNTKIDPEASAIVYSSGLPVVTVGLDVTMQCHLNANHLRQFAESKLPTVQFLWKLIQIWQNGKPEQAPILHDPLAIAVTVKPGLITPVLGRVDVETHGTPESTYGMTIYRKDPTGAVQVAQEVNSAAAIDFFLSRVLASPRRQ